MVENYILVHADHNQELLDRQHRQAPIGLVRLANTIRLQDATFGQSQKIEQRSLATCDALCDALKRNDPAETITTRSTSLGTTCKKAVEEVWSFLQ
jgi:hypothetical protein